MDARCLPYRRLCFSRLKPSGRIIYLLQKTWACERGMCFSLLIFWKSCYFLCEGGSLKRAVGASSWSHIVFAISRRVTTWELKNHHSLCLVLSRGAARAELPANSPSAGCHQVCSHLGKASRLLAEDSQAVCIPNLKFGIWRLGWAR